MIKIDFSKKLQNKVPIAKPRLSEDFKNKKLSFLMDKIESEI